MNDYRRQSGNRLQSAIVWLTVVVLLASFVSAGWINFGIRLRAEAKDRTVGLLVDYDELKRIADGSQGISFADMVRKSVVAGATGIVVRERLLADWENAGDILTFSGAQMAFYQERVGAQPDMAFTAENTYILTKDLLIYEQLFSLLEGKLRYPKAIDYPGYKGIEVRLSSLERATLGLGFPLAQLAEAAAGGMQIIPRLRNWEPVREGSLAAVYDWTAKIPNLAGIGFNDQSVPGGGTNPILQDRIADMLRLFDKPLISFEFYDQSGFSGLAARLDNPVLRAHAIAENELRKYANPRDAIDRFNLAATERNIRYIYLRFYGLENPAAAMVSNMELITAVRDGLTSEGLKVGNPEVLSSFSVPQPLRFMTGAGVIAAGVWLIALGGAPLLGKKCLPLSLAAFIGGCVSWAFLVAQLPVFGGKLLALAAAVVFPSLGIILALLRVPRQKPGTEEERHRGKGSTAGEDADAGVYTGVELRVADLLYAAGVFVALSVFTFAGAMLLSALLAAPSFMVKLDGFVGVKAAHIIPLLIIPCVLWLREKERFRLLAGTVNSSVRFWQLAAFMTMLAGFAVYILRTGNESLGTVSEIEMKIRQYLDYLLTVRPRTKEFLVGHPVMMVLLYYGYRFHMLPVLMVGAIGQISLINTYAHIHTPLSVSLLRSFHGIWIGLLFGSCAIVVFAWLERRFLVPAARYKRKGGEDGLS